MGSNGVGAPPADATLPDQWEHLSRADRRTAQILKEDFDRSLVEKYQGVVWHRELIRRSDSGLSREYYTLQLGLDPLLTMYEATGEERYLSFALELCENMVRAADRDRDGDGHPEWDAGRTTEEVAKDHGRYDLMLTDFQGACPMTRAARIVLSDAALSGKFGNRARRLSEFVERHILEKWLFDRHGIRNWETTDRWSDKMSFVVRMELDLYAIGGEPKHREIAEKFARMLLERFTQHDPLKDTYTWIRYGPDTSHCNREVTMMLQCYEDGLVFDRRDLARISNTFVKLIWDGSRAAPGFRNFHDGRNVPTMGRGPFGWGQIYDGWIKLGRYDSRVQEIGLIVWDQVKAGKFHLPGAQANGGPWAAMAMPANLLNNLVHRVEPGPS